MKRITVLKTKNIVQYNIPHLLIAVFYINCVFLPQLITPKFPVVVKVGHAHAGAGKVSII